MAHLPLHELGGYHNACCDIVVVTLLAIDQRVRLENEDVVGSKANWFQDYWEVFSAMSFGLENLVDERRD